MIYVFSVKFVINVYANKFGILDLCNKFVDHGFLYLIQSVVPFL